MKEFIEILKEKGYTVAVCESLTGGMLCSELCAVPGASRVVKGGFITYTDEMKVLLASVPEEVIKNHTAVSEETAYYMALGAREKCGADIGLSLTGYAGPDGDEVGKVCAGICIREKVYTFTFKFSGSRQSIRHQSAMQIIKETRKLL